jgi:quercetin dioxygenase-like cupin family protein
MATLDAKGFDRPDETRPLSGKGKVEVVNIGGTPVMRGTFEPGWKWSEHVKPIAGTDSCQAAHSGYALSGRMTVRMVDGKQADIGPGQAFVIPPGHDAWTVGNEACVLIDFGASVGEYAKGR